MLLSKKLLLVDKNPYMFIFPFVTSGGRRQAFTDYYITMNGSGITAGSFPVSRVWFTPHYSRGKYLTVANEDNAIEVYVSGDAQTWTLAATLQSLHAVQTVLADGVHYLFTNEGTVYSSADGVTWSAVGTNPIGITSAQGSVTYKDNKFVAATVSNYAAKVYVSTDGCATWSEALTPPNYAPQYGNVYTDGVFSVDGGFITMYHNGGTRPGTGTAVSGSTHKIYYSANGNVWETNPVLSIPSPNVPTRLASNGRVAFFTSTGYSGATGYMTRDGVNWTPFQFPAYVWRNANCSANNRYLCQSGYENTDLTLATIDISSGLTSMAVFNNISPIHRMSNDATW